MSVLAFPVPARLTGALRRSIEARIETLIALLDTLDGDADFELDDADDEDGADRELGGDDEPSLGSLNPSLEASQGGWSAGCTDDLEENAAAVGALGSGGFLGGRVAP